MEQVVEFCVSTQRQINSLASVALQSRPARDLLTAEKGGTCLFLGDDCCYFVNETGLVQGSVRELRIKRSIKELQNLSIPQVATAKKTIKFWPKYNLDVFVHT